ncbi:MAG: hypothetical protein NTZ53_07635 [Cyanobacteria bacterium]|nr:hypothetical protein [Cyanobacteriota bacterium]
MSRRLLALATGLGLLAGPLALTPRPAQAQVDAEVSFSRVRAVNLARDTAVTLNGGLSVYRPANCMFDTSLGGGPCLIRRDDQGFLFRFLGGAPGWQQLGLQPNWDTEILVSPDGRQVVQVVFNQPPGRR